MKDRSLASNPWARKGWLPARIRMAAARAEMTARSPLEVDARMRMLDYAIRLRPREGARQRLSEPAPVWQYWATGRESAPPIVQRCLRSVAEHVTDRPIIVLDDETIDAHVGLPARVIEQRAAMGPAHFSDVLRSVLLTQHGGTWIDATVLLTGPIPPEIGSAPFFAFTRPEDPFLLSSWFLHAGPAHPLVAGLSDMLLDYWSRKSALSHYFQFHYMFEAAVALHAGLRGAWESSPHWSARPPHLLQERLAAPFESSEFTALCRTSWIHKLTWKIDTDESGTFMHHLIGS